MNDNRAGDLLSGTKSVGIYMHNDVDSQQPQPGRMVQYRGHGRLLVHGDPARSLPVPHCGKIRQDPLD